MAGLAPVFTTVLRMVIVMEKTLLHILFIFGVLLVHPAAAQEVFDRFPGKAMRSEELLHLESFAAALEKDPASVGYIAYFVGPDFSEFSIRKRALRAKIYLIQKRGISPKRIIVMKAGALGETLFVLQPLLKEKPPPKWRRVG
jgi:hypothetical protein